MDNLILWYLIIGIIVFICVIVKDKIIKALANKMWLGVRIVYIAIGLFCLLPILRDFIAKDYSYAYTEQIIASTQYVENDIGNVGEILEGDVIKQSFFCNTTTMGAIGISTYNYGRNNWGTVTVQLIDDTEGGAVIQSWERSMIEFSNDEYNIFEIDNPFGLDVKGHMCTIRISTSGANEGNTITIPVVYDQYGYGGYSINGESTDDDLVFKVLGYGAKYNKENTRFFVCVFMLVVSECILVYIFKGANDDKKREKADFIS